MSAGLFDKIIAPAIPALLDLPNKVARLILNVLSVNFRLRQRIIALSLATELKSLN